MACLVALRMIVSRSATGGRESCKSRFSFLCSITRLVGSCTLHRGLRLNRRTRCCRRFPVNNKGLVPRHGKVTGAVDQQTFTNDGQLASDHHPVEEKSESVNVCLLSEERSCLNLQQQNKCGILCIIADAAASDLLTEVPTGIRIHRRLLFRHVVNHSVPFSTEEQDLDAMGHLKWFWASSSHRSDPFGSKGDAS